MSVPRAIYPHRVRAAIAAVAFPVALFSREESKPHYTPMTPPRHLPTPRSFVFAFGIIFGLSAEVLTAADGPASRPQNQGADKGEVVELSPFMVSTSGDIGYLAQNSLSGSRLNTKLSDLAAPTTAFTQEFLDDIGSTSVDDLYQYMVGTQITFAENGAVNAGYSDDGRSTTIRGLPGGRNSVDYFPSDIKLDHFDTERVDFSRGANSILFGMGSPGGVINVSTKRARLNQVSGSLSVQARSWNGIRGVLDYNQPIVKDRLSVRLAAVRDRRESWREHEWNDQDRLYLTARWKIAPRTTLDIQGEHSLVTKFESPAFVAFDAYTPWVSAGRQLYSSGAFNAAAGIQTIGNTNYLVLDTATGVATDWRGKAMTTNRTVDGANGMLTDFHVIPKQAAVLGISFPQNTNYSRESVFITHAFTPHLNAEIGATASLLGRYVYQATAATLVLRADPNLTLPNGQPNPNAGRAYFEGEPTQTPTHTRNAGIRANVSYERDFGRYVGRHVIAGLVEQDWQHYRHWQDKLLMVDNPYNRTAPDNAANSPHFRTYVDLNGPVENIALGDWRRIPVGQVTDSLTGRQAGFAWTNSSPAGASDNRFALKSYMAVLQSRFLGERLITVVGFREDVQHAWYSRTAVRNPPFGSFTTGAYQVVPGLDDTRTRADNKTFGAVYHLFRGFSLVYNHATNASLPNPDGSVPTDSGGRVPSPIGRSEDIGFKFDLGHRVYLTASYFTSSARNDFVGGVNAAGEDMFNTIWNALAAAKVSLPDGKSADVYQTRANGYTVDSTSHGYEVELIANPTDSWHVFLNFSDITLKQTNLGRDSRSYFAKYREFWLSDDNGRVLLDQSGQRAPVANDGSVVIDTVAKGVAQLETRLNNTYVLPDGRRPRGQIRYQGNVRTSYRFSSGALNGWSIGSGVRGRSGGVTNYDVASRRVVLGRANTLVDFNTGYTFRRNLAGLKGRWSVLLNINNVFDETQILPLRTSLDGTIISYRLQTPREFILTTKLDF